MESEDTPKPYHGFPAEWALKSALERTNSGWGLSEIRNHPPAQPSPFYNAVVLLARMIEQHEAPPKTVVELATLELDNAISTIIYPDHESERWGGTWCYATRIVAHLDKAGFAIVRKESAQ